MGFPVSGCRSLSGGDSGLGGLPVWIGGMLVARFAKALAGDGTAASAGWNWVGSIGDGSEVEKANRTQGGREDETHDFGKLLEVFSVDGDSLPD